MRRALAGTVAGLLIWLALGCVNSTSTPPTADPLRSINRPIFRFNVALDDYVAGPVARGYKRVTPQRMRTSVTNFFYNVDFPKRFVSSVGQAEGHKAASEVARFAVNSTFGIGGLFDLASRMGLEKYDEDVGQMLGRWGLPGGPYWVLPILGPSNPRDTVGIAGEAFLSPIFWVSRLWINYLGLGLGVLNQVNRRAEFDEEIADFRRGALDLYVSTRDAYLSRREAQIANEDPDAKDDEPGDDLYDFDEEPDAETP